MSKKEIALLINEIGGTVGISAENINSQKSFKLNNDKVFPSASVIKIFILYSALEKVLNKELSLTDNIEFGEKNLIPDSPFFETLGKKEVSVTLYDLLTSMINVSDNTSTNLAIDLLGFDVINESIKNLGLHNTKLQRKMYDFESRERGIDNFTSPDDMMIFFRMLIKESLITSEQIKNFDIFDITLNNYLNLATLKILSTQTDLEKIPRFFDKTYFIANKTGELPDIRNDVALIIKNEKIYIISFFTQNVNDELESDKLISKVSFLLINKVLN